MTTTDYDADYLGRPLITPDSNARDYMGRPTTTTTDYMGRTLAETSILIAVTDNFNRTNGPLGDNWTTPNPLAAPQIDNNQATGPTTGGDYLANWTANTIHPNQYTQAEITINAPGDNYTNAYIIVRSADNGLDGYVALWQTSSAGGYRLMRQGVELAAVHAVGNTGTRTLRLEAIDDQITLYVDDEETLTVTNDAVTEGHPGIGSYYDTAGTPATINNFAAGEL